MRGWRWGGGWPGPRTWARGSWNLILKKGWWPPDPRRKGLEPDFEFGAPFEVVGGVVGEGAGQRSGWPCHTGVGLKLTV